MRHENSALENSKSIRATEAALAAAEAEKIEKKIALKEAWLKNYHIRMDMKARTDSEHQRLMEAARDQALSTVIKAIYITALEGEALVDENLILAENMVDNWIKSRGGASKILNGISDNTYLLARITQIVEDAAEATVEEIEKDETAEDKKDEAEAKAKEFIQSADKEEIKDFMNNLIDNIQDKAEDKAEDKEEDGSSEGTAEEAKPEDGSEEVEVDVEDKADDEEVDLDAEIDVKDDDSEDKKDDEKEPEESEEEEKESDDDDGKEEKSEDDKKSDDESSEKSEEKSEDSEKDDESEQSNEESDDDVDLDAEIDAKEEDGEEEKTEAEKSEEAPDDLDVTDADGDGEISDKEIEQDNNEDLGEPIDDESPAADTNIDAEIEDNANDGESKLFDDLENEEDVQKAVELIRNRVADAEETFIRNNAEDKKKMDEILTKISNNVKTVEDLSDKDPEGAKIAQEMAMDNKARMNDIKFGRDLTVFERMSRILTENIVKNENVKAQYLTESGRLDVNLVVETVKVMYGFLETLNTLQIENVDEKFIAKTLMEMKEEG